MEIERFLTLGAELETRISGLYRKIAALTPEEAKSKILMKISDEELNHAAALKTGLNYLKEAPELFLGANISEEDLNLGLRECRELQESLQHHPGFLAGLKWILKIEKQFERAHIGAAAILSDAQLKQLFQAMAKGDQNHIGTLQGLISGLEMN